MKWSDFKINGTDVFWLVTLHTKPSPISMSLSLSLSLSESHTTNGAPPRQCRPPLAATSTEREREIEREGDTD
jgi:hypothetical protein